MEIRMIDGRLCVCLPLHEFADLTEEVQEQLIQTWCQTRFDGVMDEIDSLFAQQHPEWLAKYGITEWDIYVPPTYEFVYLECRSYPWSSVADEVVRRGWSPEIDKLVRENFLRDYQTLYENLTSDITRENAIRDLSTDLLYTKCGDGYVNS